MIGYEITYYIGLVLTFGGLITSIVFLYFIKKNESKYESFIDLIKKNLIKLGIPTLAFILGFVLLNLAFYLDPNTSIYLETNNITIKWYHQVMVYLFGILFAISLMAFIYSLFIKLYIEKFEIKRKYTTMALGFSLALTIVFFFLWGEGNAPYLEYPLANAIYIGAKGIKLVNIYKYYDNYTDGLTIYLYALFILSGACLVLYVCDYKLYKIYGKHDLITNTFLIAFPSGVIGARIWYVILSVSSGSTDFTGANWVNIFNFRMGGLGIMGGAVLGIIAGVAQVLVVKYGMKRSQYKNFSLLKAIDIIIPSILFAQALGRIGNFFNNEVYGQLVDISYWEFLPTWIKNNMYFQHGSILSTEVDGVSLVGETALHYYLENGKFYVPLFFVEFLSNLAGYFILEYLIRKLLGKYHSDGSLLGGYLIWYGVTRAILEPLRTEADYYATSEITSYIMIGGGLLIVALAVFNNFYIKKNRLLWYKNYNEENDVKEISITEEDDD